MPTMDSTKQYFEQVMERWSHQRGPNHPYADNKPWQKKYAALVRWIDECRLQRGRTLEVGCGTGLLQDATQNYIGVDIAAGSAAFMHKPFCVCTATQLPFTDNSFDGAWSIWVLEHVDDPDQMLSELRRVVRPGGSIFICAGYAVGEWIAQGLHTRPYGALTFREKLVKLTIPVRNSRIFKVVSTLPLRLIDLARFILTKRPTKLRFKRLNPNYESYWDYDADASVSLDAFNVALYFLSRGDQPFYKLGMFQNLLLRSQPQVYIVRK